MKFKFKDESWLEIADSGEMTACGELAHTHYHHINKLIREGKTHKEAVDLVLRATPGPWELGIKDHKGNGIIFGFNRIPVTIFDGETKEADARLMVLAPELLKALENFKELIDDCIKEGEATQLIRDHYCYEEIENVIMKAKNG